MDRRGAAVAIFVALAGSIGNPRCSRRRAGHGNAPGSS